MTIIGVDLGLDGAIAARDSVEDMPTIRIKKGKTGYRRELDWDALIGKARAWKTMDAIVYFEKTFTLPRMSAPSAYNFGGGCVGFEVMLKCFGIPYHKVMPKDWQKEMLRGTTKDDKKHASFTIAGRRHPDLDLGTKNKGRADAVNILDFAMMRERGTG